MALFKLFRGNSANLPTSGEMVKDGHAFFCTDDGKFIISYEENGIIKQKRVNEAELEKLGYDIEQIKAQLQTQPQTQVQADWNQKDEAAVDFIKNKPFYDHAEEIFNWNGDTSDKEVYMDTFVRVSDQTFTLEQLQDHVLEVCSEGGSEVVPADFEDEVGSGFYNELTTGIVVLVYDPSAMETVLGFSLPIGMYTIAPEANGGTYIARLYKEDVKQLDAKFIPDSIARVDQILKQVQTDFNQNDTTAVDFIKNRPFYGDKTVKYPATYYVPGTTKPEGNSWPDNVCWRFLTDKQDAITDDAQVTFITYEPDPESGMAPVTDVCSGAEAKTRNLIKWSTKDSMWKAWVEEPIGPDAVVVSKVDMPVVYDTSNFKQLDDKYVSDNIARVDYVDEAIAAISTSEQVQADYAQGDVNAKDYIKNRPFYEDAANKQYMYTPNGATLRNGGYAYQLLTTESINWPEDTTIHYEYWGWGPVNGDESNIQYHLMSSESVLWKDFPSLLIWLEFSPYDTYPTGWYAQAARLGSDSGEHVTSITVDSFKGTIKQLDAKFIPDSIARTSDLVANVQDGSNTGSLQQVPDGVANGFSFTGKNPNATSIDSTLTGTLPYGAVGNYTSAFGGKSLAQGKRSHAEGTTTVAKGNYSHVEGDNSVTLGADSHAEGYATVTGPDAQAGHAEGINTQALGKASHSEGQDTIAYGQDSHAEGSNTATVLKDEQGNVIAVGEAAHAEGGHTKSVGKYSHTEGYMSQASAEAAHAEGKNTIATENGAHAEGNSTEASGQYAHAEGNDTHATSSHAHAEGKSTTAKGENAHAEGDTTIAEGISSHAGGTGAHAKGSYSFAHGNMVVAEYANQFVVGRFNSNKEGTLFEIGNGDDTSHRDNAFEVYKNGEVYAGGVRLLKEGEAGSSANIDPAYAYTINMSSVDYYPDDEQSWRHFRFMCSGSTPLTDKSKIVEYLYNNGYTSIETAAPVIYSDSNGYRFSDKLLSVYAPSSTTLYATRAGDSAGFRLAWYESSTSITPMRLVSGLLAGTSSSGSVGEQDIKNALISGSLEWSDTDKAAACQKIGAVAKNETELKEYQVLYGRREERYGFAPKLFTISQAPSDGALLMAGSYTNWGATEPTANGAIICKEPIQPYQTANKKYVDDNFIGKVKDTSGFNRVYYIQNGTTDTSTYDLMFPAQFNTEENAKRRYGIPAYTAGRLGCAPPEGDYEAANKKYVDDITGDIATALDEIIEIQDSLLEGNISVGGGGSGTKFYVHSISGAANSLESDYHIYILCNRAERFDSQALIDACRERFFSLNATEKCVVIAKWNSGRDDIVSANQNGETSCYVTYASGAGKTLDFSNESIASYDIADV